MLCACAISCSVTYTALQFPTLSHKRNDFRQKDAERKMCVVKFLYSVCLKHFCTAFVWNISVQRLSETFLYSVCLKHFCTALVWNISIQCLSETFLYSVFLKHFCTTFVWNISQSKKHWARYDLQYVSVCMWSEVKWSEVKWSAARYCCQILMKSDCCGQSFE